jgi:hypothetical protein
MIILKVHDCYLRQFLSANIPTKLVNMIREKSPKILFLLKHVASTVITLL